MVKQGILSVGDKICVISHPNEVATIAEGKHVKYKSEIMSMNMFGCKATGQMLFKASLLREKLMVKKHCMNLEKKR